MPNFCHFIDDVVGRMVFVCVYSITLNLIIASVFLIIRYRMYKDILPSVSKNSVHLPADRKTIRLLDFARRIDNGLKPHFLFWFLSVYTIGVLMLIFFC